MLGQDSAKGGGAAPRETGTDLPGRQAAPRVHPSRGEVILAAGGLLTRQTADGPKILVVVPGFGGGQGGRLALTRGGAGTTERLILRAIESVSAKS